MTMTGPDIKKTKPARKANQSVGETKRPDLETQDVVPGEGRLLRTETLEWIERRSHVSEVELVRMFPSYRDWKYGRVRISSDEIRELADFTCEPPLFFIIGPFADEDTITDFRGVGSVGVLKKEIDLEPSLRERVTKSDLQRDWLREFREEGGFPKVEWVGRCLWPNSSPAEGARILAELLDVNRSEFLLTSEYLSALVSKAEQLGVLVQSTNVATRRERRPLDLDVFNSFQLFDEFVPLVFLHSDTSDEAQVFVLVHSLAHLLLGETGVCLARVEDLFHLNGIELWCSQVALEYLIPEKELLPKVEEGVRSNLDTIGLATHFRINPLIMTVRLKQLDKMSSKVYFLAYRKHRNAYFDDKVRTARYFTQESQIRGVGLPLARAIANQLYDNEITLKEAWRTLDLPHDEVHRTIYRLR